MNPSLGKVFVFCSVLLIVVGVLQVFVRPRKDRETTLEKIINRSTIWAVVCVLFGTLGLLMGLGIVPMIRMRLG